MAKFIKKHALETENDFTLADEMLSLSDYTEDYESEDYYKARTESALAYVGTYEIAIDRDGDFQEFKRNAYYALCEYKSEEYYNAERESVERSEIQAKRLEMNRFLETITFEEWKAGKLESGMKLGKKLQKEGFSQAVLDYYGTQIKSEKIVYLTITDRVHDIVGMSNFAEEESWDGYEGTSCQDTRHNCSYNFNLLGAIADSNLMIAQLHYKLEDVEDMQDNLKARTLVRAWKATYNNKQYSICKGVKFYGDNTTKSEMEAAFQALEDEGLSITSGQ